MTDLQTKSAGDLGKDLTELRREQFNLRLQLATGQSTKSHRLKEIRRDIARVKTVLNIKGREQ